MNSFELQPLSSSTRQLGVDVRPQHIHLMKFSNSLKFNANAEWWDEYIACVFLLNNFALISQAMPSYSALKKQIYTLEAEVPIPGQSRDVERGERSSLLGEHNRRETNAIFKPLLDAELAKIVAFYDLQEKELLYDVMELEQLVIKTEEEGIGAGNGGDSDDGSDEDEDEDDARSNGGSPLTERRRSGSQSQGMSSTRTLGE